VLEEEVVEAPLGHRLRREEAKPEIMKKFERHLTPHFSAEHVKKLMALSDDTAALYKMPVDEYVDLYVTEKIL
jgi:2-methylcitrate dehydratase